CMALTNKGRSVAGVLAVAVLTAATWWLWLGWNTGYRVDPATGGMSGPYRAGQGGGCGRCLVAIAAGGGGLLNPGLVAPTLAVIFTAVWSADAVSRDGSGLWLVGAVLIFIGTGFGATVVSTGAWLMARHRRHRRLKERQPESGESVQMALQG